MIKRVCELERGDIFEWMSCIFIVRIVSDKRIYYSQYNDGEKVLVGKLQSFGNKNQMKVSFLGNNPKKRNFRVRVYPNKKVKQYS